MAEGFFSPFPQSPRSVKQLSEDNELDSAQDLRRPSPSKICTVMRLLQNQVLSSPARWGWICTLAEKLLVEPDKVNGKMYDKMLEQANVLEDRAAASAEEGMAAPQDQKEQVSQGSVAGGRAHQTG